MESAELRRLLINNSAKEIRVGDRLLVREETPIGVTIFPTGPALDIEGCIVAFLGNEQMVSQLDTVVINLGAGDNLAIACWQAIAGRRLAVGFPSVAARFWF